MKNIISIFIFAFFTCCESSKTVTFKELVGFSAENGPPPPCPTLEEMKKKWNGKDSSYGHVVDFKSGPNKMNVLKEFIECEYEAEVDPSKY